MRFVPWLFFAASASLSTFACDHTPPPIAPKSNSRPQLVQHSSVATVTKTESAAVPEWVEKLQSGPFQSYEIARSLTDSVGPRMAGGPGDHAAVEWALAAMKSAGFSNVHSEPVRVPHWERGSESAEIVSPVHQRLAVTAIGGSTATPPRGIEGELVEVDSMDALKSLDPKVAKGKIVFINAPMPRTKDGSGYGKTVGLRFRGAKLATEAGATAVVLRSVGTDHNRLPHTGTKSTAKPKPGEKAVTDVPIGAISIPDAELLHRMVAAGPTRVRLVLNSKVLPDADSANVVGEVVGAEHPDQIVFAGAHLDSWDLATGAIDDAAGCAIVMGAAEAIAARKERPKRTIRIVLFANEESGISGAKAYGSAHASEAARHIVAMEADLGAGRVYGIAYLGSPDKRHLFDEIAPFVKPLSVDSLDKDAWGGSDLSPLHEQGVPLIDLRQDASDYFDYHHTANDTFDKIDEKSITQAAAAYATVLWAVANSDDDFGRIPEDKRKD